MSLFRDMGEICRDEHCELDGLHAPEECEQARRTSRIELLYEELSEIKGAKPAPTPKRPASLKDDPEGIREAVLRAIPKNLPTHFGAVADAVRNDYGEVAERTVYRHIKRLVKAGELVKQDLRLGFAAYVRPYSKMLRDLPTMRDVLVHMTDLEPDHA